MTAPGVLERQALASGPPGPGQALVRTLVTVVSPGTELDIFHGRDPEAFEPGAWQRYPFRPGYVQVGEVVTPGPDCALRAGEVVLTSAGHRSLAVVDGAAAWPVPAGFPAEHAGLLRLAAISCTALRQSRTIPGDRVAVFGLGLIGHLAAQLFALTGRRVVGVDPVDGRRALAREVGLSAVAGPANVGQALGGDPDSVVDAVGRPAIVLQAADAVVRGGEVILLGTPRVAERVENVTRFFRRVHSAGLHVIGAHGNSLPARAPGRAASVRRNLDDLHAWAAAGRLLLRPLVTHHLGAGELPRAYEGLERQRDAHMAIVLDWRGGGA